MSIRNVVTRGYSAGATIPFVVTRGYTIGEAIEEVVDEFFFGPDDILQDDDTIILAVIKDFIKRVT